MLLYHLEVKESGIWVRLQEQGTRRILYLDTLQAIATKEDQEPLALLLKPLVRGSRDTQAFQYVPIPPGPCLEKIAATGRLFHQGKKLTFARAKIVWKGEPPSTISAFLEIGSQLLALKDCEMLTAACFLHGSCVGKVDSPISWRWIELFKKGPVSLEGVQKKRFLEEEPPITWSQAVPQLILQDALGCLVKLADLSWEKDLLEVGFIRKMPHHYYCPTDKVREYLRFLLELGWRVIDFRGRTVHLQTDTKLEMTEQKEAIAVQGVLQFQSLAASLKSAKKGALWVDLNSDSVGLLDQVPSLEGVWEADTLLIPKQRAVQLEPLLHQSNIQWDQSVRRLVEGFSQGIEFAPPAPSFRATLLPYQQKGLDWLQFLYRFGFSGLLADEMGLGKTVQVLAFFSTLEKNLPILIVAPTSLLFHWRSEIERFLGEPVHVYSGPDRKLVPSRFILTSYAILRLDSEKLSAVSFEVIVLDESNAIKTSGTQIAQAAYKLNGKMKIALTGTPIENRPEELLSQFRFLLPDLLTDKDLEKAKRKIRPFLLKRKKEEVGLDLPEKIEQIAWIEMDSEQKELYETYRTRIKSSLGQDPTRMEVLEAILRLRQICCDPALVGEKATSAKLDHLMDNLEQVSGRKILIYSQFTSMLQRIRQKLDEQNLSYCYLDGATAPSQREAQVVQFQNDPNTNLFLLSLKAGGVGLNLVAADYVILFDPWWNEAVEAQAMARAHRIGQKNTVIARRYLIPNTIEEKMLKIKAQKAKKATELLDEEGSWTHEDLLELLS